MILPSEVAGPLTQTVGLFEWDHRQIAEWYAADQPNAKCSDSPWQSIEDLNNNLPRRMPQDINIFAAWGEWTVMLGNGKLGTDVGLIPMHVARKFDCRAIQATSIERGTQRYPAQILSVFGPDGESLPLPKMRRAIHVMNDGGRWVFGTAGAPFEFEDTSTYSERRKSDRFTRDQLLRYLQALGVPEGNEPDWSSALVVEAF